LLNQSAKSNSEPISTPRMRQPPPEKPNQRYNANKMSDPSTEKSLPPRNTVLHGAP
jgi:hypothetical protein